MKKSKHKQQQSKSRKNRKQATTAKPDRRDVMGLAVKGGIGLAVLLSLIHI